MFTKVYTRVFFYLFLILTAAHPVLGQIIIEPGAGGGSNAEGCADGCALIVPLVLAIGALIAGLVGACSA